MSNKGATVLSDGHSKAKGRNGHFRLDRIAVGSFEDWNDGGQWKVEVSFLAKRSSWPGPCYAELSYDDARALADALMKELSGP